MSIRTEQRPAAETRGGVTRQEALAALAEVLALFLVFIVAFTGRDTFSDGLKTGLIVLSVVVGLAGAVVGAVIVRRGTASPTGRVTRIALGAFMVFIGVYTIIHVLS